ncbi:YrhA family protein [Pseudomonas plecoglossicida]|uniref:YrhA family protein n=1 Tax=Pseudomonas plecoglossicida TaxID=70775 RepID=UPI003D25F6AC
MNSAIYAKISGLRYRLDDAAMYLGPPATPADIVAVTNAVTVEFSVGLPSEYLDFLRTFNGLVACGVFVYSSRSRVIPGGDTLSPNLVEMNYLSRDVDFMKDFLVFADSDQDEYVLDLRRGKYQVRDRQAFDNIFEEFDTFDGVLEFMVDLIIKRS